MRRESELLVLALCLGAIGFVAGARWAGRPDAAAIRRADSVQSVLQALELHGRADSAVNVVRADSISRLRLTVARLVARQPTVQSKTDTLLAVVPDTALRDSLLGAITAERGLADTVRMTAQAVILLWTDRYKSAVAERDSYRNVAAELNRQLQQAVRRPQRSRLRPCAFAGYGISGPTAGGGACYSF